MNANEIIINSSDIIDYQCSYNVSNNEIEENRNWENLSKMFKRSIEIYVSNDNKSTFIE